jgi:hypothetical protein
MPIAGIDEAVACQWMKGPLTAAGNMALNRVPIR